MIKKIFYSTAALIIIVLLIKATAFTVDESKCVILTQFGRPVKTMTEPGLKWKFPDPVQSVIRFEKRLLVYDPKPCEFLTRDKKNVVVDSFICWKIEDPQRFLETVKDVTGAEIRLSDIMSSQLGAALGEQPLSALVSVEPGKMEVSRIMARVCERCRETARREYGIEVVDVKMKRLNLPPDNKASVFRRMRSER